MEYHAKGPGIEPNGYTESTSKTYYPTHVNYVEGLENKIAEVIKYNDVVGDKLEKDANAVSATKLKTARTLQTNLASTAAVNFDGTSNASIGVTGILPVANGGTGANNLSSVTVGTATKLETARNIQTNLASTTAGSFNGTASVSAGVTGILPVANGGTGQSNLSNVTVGAARKLETSRSLQTNLASTAAVNFDGTSNASIGVTGILPVANGGTGKNNLSSVTVGAARKLETSRSLQTNLASTAAVNFDGTSNTSIGVTGILPVTNGGTGQSNLANVTVGAASKATLDSAGNKISDFFAPVTSPDLKGTPQAVTVTDLDDDSNKIATTAFVAAIIRRLMGATPETLNTLQELAVAVNKDPNFATTVANQLDQKQDKHVALTSISGLTTAANKMIYTTAANVYETTALTAFARTILDDADAQTMRNTLNVLSKTETAPAATKLETARNIQTNLASTTAGSFNGTASVSAGVTGILPVANGGTGQNNLSNVTVGAASKATLDSAGNNISTYYGKKFTSTALTLTKANWKTDTAETSDYKYYYEVTVSGLTTADLVEVFYSRASMNTVLEAGICPSSNDSMSGKFRIYAAAIPTANINATYVVWKG